MKRCLLAGDLSGSSSLRAFLPKIYERFFGLLRGRRRAIIEARFEGRMGLVQTILVVDDERNIVELARLYLSREGYKILASENGREALEIFGRSVRI